ncbi:hypothetical protein [Deinococcus multiflagellatus]|uniref:Uncharacterized protein n=1 Tax=Deinococcus multiflagellatus TaxID=1656887 RepID=A0ABW1ZQ17_9DEIO|nr:hypothetical protein [Deinococcus multiflagellatus]MBZ9714912.1 hypothetical protein [Deinococcus multiflagellatus]
MHEQAEQGQVNEQARVSQKAFLATRYAFGAVYQAGMAEQLQLAGAAPNKPGWSALCSTVVAALDQSVSFLDANLMELAVDVLPEGRHSGLPEGLLTPLRQALNGRMKDRDQLLRASNVVRAAMGLEPFSETAWAALPRHARETLEKTLWKNSDAVPGQLSPLLTKHNAVLTAAGQTPFQETDPEFEAVRVLLKLRNVFTHPDVVSVEVLDGQLLKQAKLEPSLQGRFPRHPEFPTYLPHGVMTPACARWAINTALTFADAFHARLGIEGRYERKREDLRRQLAV